MPNKVFFDANVLLEIANQGKNAALAITIARRHVNQLHISALTAHLVLYFGLKFASAEALRDLLSDYQILPLDNQDIIWAFNHLFSNDYEDALQMSVALRGGCNVFYTFDRQLYQMYRATPQLKVVLLTGEKTD